MPLHCYSCISFHVFEQSQMPFMGTFAATKLQEIEDRCRPLRQKLLLNQLDYGAIYQLA